MTSSRSPYQHRLQMLALRRHIEKAPPKMIKRAIKALPIVAVAAVVTSCTDADVASHNLSKAADNFEIQRRVVFYNGITGGYMLSIEGLCSLGNNDKAREVSITCKTGPDAYKKHFLGLSDNVTFFVEQLEPKSVSAYHYRVVFKPQTIIPDVDFRASAKELSTDRN